MDVFDLRHRLVSDYRDYTRSFIRIRDPRIKGFVDDVLDKEGFWPEPLLQLNPTFRPGGTIDDLVAEGVLHEECAHIFRTDKSDTDHRGRPLLLHRHQREAILQATAGRSCVLTTGTGSGKSLAYIVPIVDHVLRSGSGQGIRAIVVYPMNALANSQDEELGKFLCKGYPEGRAPVRFARYTGQERGTVREAIRSEPPDILLTNYMRRTRTAGRRHSSPAKTAARTMTTAAMTPTCISPRKHPGPAPPVPPCWPACRTRSRRRPPRAWNGSGPTPAGTSRSRSSSSPPGGSSPRARERPPP